MTVPLQNPVTTNTANGISVVYTYDFLCLDPADLTVIVNYVEVDPSTYTVLSYGSNTGGEIQFNDPPADGLSIIIRLNVRLDRETNYQYSGDFMSPVVNKDFDRLWLSQQSQQVDLESALKAIPGETVGYLPSISIRKGKALVFNDETGQPEPSLDDYNDQAIAAAASADAAAQSSADAAGAAGTAISAADAAAISAQEAAEAVTDIAQYVTVAPAGGITATNVQDALEELDAIKVSAEDAKWLGTPIGGYIISYETPPTDDPRYRYVLCTAGESGPGGYNEGVLENESVTGSGALIIANADVSYPGSPMDGINIPMVNTEGRFIGAGVISALANDSFQNITGSWLSIGSQTAPNRFTDAVMNGAFKLGVSAGTQVLTGASNTNGRALEFDASQSPGARASDRTQPKAQFEPHYRRIF